MTFKKVELLPFVILIAICFLMYAVPFGVDHYKNYKQAEKIAQETSAEVIRLAKRSIKSVNVEHLKCLATNIYHEARGEPFMGQVAVARVVMNRIKHGFGSNPCKVVYQTYKIPDDSDDGFKKVCQFSWVCQGKETPPRNSDYLLAERIAKSILVDNKWEKDIPSNILFFHANTVNPGWNYQQVVKIGNHIFYSKNKDKKQDFN